MRQTFCYLKKQTIFFFYILSLHDVASDSHFVLGKFTLFVSVSPCYFLAITEKMSAVGGYWLWILIGFKVLSFLSSNSYLHSTRQPILLRVGIG